MAQDPCLGREGPEPEESGEAIRSIVLASPETGSGRRVEPGVQRTTPGTDYPDGTRRAEMAKEQARRDAQQAELLVEARVAVFDTKKAELVAQKILAQHKAP